MINDTVVSYKIIVGNVIYKRMPPTSYTAGGDIRRPQLPFPGPRASTVMHGTCRKHVPELPWSLVLAFHDSLIFLYHVTCI